MSMGEIIKSNRLRLGLSQEKLGEILGVNKAAVQKWESGLVENIKRSKIKLLAELFSITPTELLGWADDFKEEKSNQSLSSLTEEEQSLINFHRELNDEGKERLLRYAEDLVASGNYKKYGSAGMVQSS